MFASALEICTRCCMPPLKFSDVRPCAKAEFHMLQQFSRSFPYVPNMVMQAAISFSAMLPPLEKDILAQSGDFRTPSPSDGCEYSVCAATIRRNVRLPPCTRRWSFPRMSSSSKYRLSRRKRCRTRFPRQRPRFRRHTVRTVRDYTPKPCHSADSGNRPRVSGVSQEGQPFP